MTGGVKKQARRVVPLVLDCAAGAPFEIGARLDAALCYPTWPVERQQKVADAICAELIAYSIELEPERGDALRAAYPAYLKSKSRASLGSLFNRRADAFRAGKGLLPLLKSAAIGQPPILRGREGELSLAVIARYVSSPLEKRSDTNYDERLHERMKRDRRFLPIAHLVAAYQTVAYRRAGANEAAAVDYQDLDLHREVVFLANEYACYFRALPRWSNIANALMPIEWRE